MASIKKDLINGVFWSAVEKYSGLIVSLVVSMVLARILSPAEYGVVAVATVIITFLQIFGTIGIGPAVIQKNLSQSDINSIFTFSLSLGIIITLLFFSASWFIADFYNNNLLIPICQILCIQVFFTSANVVPNALMAKNKRFKEIAKRTLTLQLTSGIFSIVAALKGAGVYALLISPVISSIGIFIWNLAYYKVDIDWKCNMEPVKRIFSFSFYQFMFEFVNYFSRNLDKLIIGKAMNVDMLGIYEKAYRLMQLPLQNVTSVINPVLQPVLRSLQDDKLDLANKYAKIVRFVATLSFPIGVILAFMSKEVIYLFFGKQWEAAIPIFSILSLSLPLQMILSTTGSIYLICNNTKMLFWIGIRNTVTTVIGFIIAIIFFCTLESMAWAWTITLILNFVFTYWLMYRYVLYQPIIPFLKELLRPTLSAILIAFFMFLLNQIEWLDNWKISIIVKGITSVLFTLICIQLFGQYDLINYMRSKLKNK